MQAKTLVRWTAVHRWSSLFCTLNLLLLLLTGLPLIFHQEIDAALGVAPGLEHPADAAVLPMERTVQLALDSQGPSWTPSVYFEDDKHPGAVIVSLLPPGVKEFDRARPVYLNAYTGAVLPDLNFQKGLTNWLLRLHTNLFLGFGGQLYLTVVGVAFFVTLVSGAAVYAPFLRGRSLGELRRGRGQRVFHLDLHNLVGVASLGWCSVVALTGIVLELSQPLIAIYAYTDLARATAADKNLPPPAQPAPLAAVVASARAPWPGHRVVFAVFPRTPLSGERHYAFFLAAEHGIARRVFEISLVDAGTGKLTRANEAPWYLRTLLVSGPLHFGDYGGLPLKIIWTLFSLLTLALAAGGVYLTVARVRARRAGGSKQVPERADGTDLIAAPAGRTAR